MKATLILLIFIPSIVSAKTIFEPSLSLNNGGFSGKISGSNTISDGTEINATYSTFSTGIRYGITRRYVHVTGILEGYLVNLSTDQNVNTDLQFKTNIGLGIGYEWNIPLRTYVILGSPFSGVEFSYYFSESLMVGLKYSKMKFEFAGADLSVNTYGVAVSFPIEFDYPDHWWRKKDWE